MKRIGLIGCGAIGSELALAIDSMRNAKLVALFDTYPEYMYKLAERLHHKPITADLDRFLSSNMDLVIEAASQEAVRSYARVILKDHDLMVMSVGALLDDNLYNDCLKIAEEHNRRLYIPTGAIAGIDAIRSVKDLLEEVIITTTKNPRGLKGAPFFALNKLDPDMIKEKAMIYEGYARDAVRLFPANVNVAATLSLAGIGADKTKVRIVADPDALTNTHEIFARGKFGEMYFKVSNTPSPSNPKTSYLAILSAIECLRHICDDKIHIGT